MGTQKILKMSMITVVVRLLKVPGYLCIDGYPEYFEEEDDNGGGDGVVERAPSCIIEGCAGVGRAHCVMLISLIPTQQYPRLCLTALTIFNHFYMQ